MAVNYDTCELAFSTAPLSLVSTNMYGVPRYTQIYVYPDILPDILARFPAKMLFQEIAVRLFWD